MTRKLLRPKKFSKIELAKVNVDVLRQNNQLFLRCQICGTIWLPKTNQKGQLLPGYWQCPNAAVHNSMLTREEVAYHEAGHAVMGYLLGVGIDYATIEPNNEVAGRVSYVVSLDKLPPSQQVMITLAGPIAEDMVTATPRFATFDDLMYHSEGDGRGVLQVINRYRDEVDVPGHYKVAKYLLKKHRRAVEVVAQELLTQDRLSGERIVTIVNR